MMGETQAKPTHDDFRQAGAAARIILQDRHLADTLDSLAMEATQSAIGHPDGGVREDNRQRVLAIASLRNALRTIAEEWKHAAEMAEIATKRE
jgi:hypothetical protein